MEEVKEGIKVLFADRIRGHVLVAADCVGGSKGYNPGTRLVCDDMDMTVVGRAFIKFRSGEFHYTFEAATDMPVEQFAGKIFTPAAN